MQKTRRYCQSSCTLGRSPPCAPASPPIAPTGLRLHRHSEVPTCATQKLPPAAIAHVGRTLLSDDFDWSPEICRTRVSDPHERSPTPPSTPPEFPPETSTARSPPAGPSHTAADKPRG